ncbi:MAG: hypothetical protein K8H75_17270 [Sulfuricella sp.]|nr:hypothetical protein [Sulfuricella sp.]
MRSASNKAPKNPKNDGYADQNEMGFALLGGGRGELHVNPPEHFPFLGVRRFRAIIQAIFVNIVFILVNRRCKNQGILSGRVDLADVGRPGCFKVELAGPATHSEELAAVIGNDDCVDAFFLHHRLSERLKNFAVAGKRTVFAGRRKLTGDQHAPRPQGAVHFGNAANHDQNTQQSGYDDHREHRQEQDPVFDAPVFHGSPSEVRFSLLFRLASSSRLIPSERAT